MNGLAAGVMAVFRGDPGGLLHRRVSDLLKSRYGARDVLLTDSGTSALRLAIAGALRGSDNRPVALPGYCCYDVATAAVGAGASLAVYDLDPHTLGPDLKGLESVIRLGPAAVVIAHLYGLPVDVSAVVSRIGDALLIEDAAQGAGGTLNGAPVGSFGSVSVLSFGRGKGMTGSGGWALLAHDDRGATIVEWARGQLASAPSNGSGRRLGLLAAQVVFGRPALYGIPAALPFLRLGETVYRPPWKPRAASVASLAVLGHMMEDIDREAAVRRMNAAQWLQCIDGSARVRRFAVAAGAEPGYLRFPLQVLGGIDATDLRPLQRHGVMPGYPTSLPALPELAAKLVDQGVRLSGAQHLASTIVTLPTHSRLSSRDLAAVQSWLRG